MFERYVPRKRDRPVELVLVLEALSCHVLERSHRLLYAVYGFLPRVQELVDQNRVEGQR